MRTAVVTGANKGIGLALCRELVIRGYGVVATCRRTSALLQQTGADVIEGIDVTEPAAIEALRTYLHGRSIDLLVNNAGVTARESFATLDFAAIRQQFEVNSLGPLRITHALAGNLGSGSKVAILGSRAGSLASIESGGRYAYRMSKAAAHMAGTILAHDLRARGIAVFLLYPGYVATEMMNGQGTAPELSAQQILNRLEVLGMQQSGMFYHVNGERLPW